MKRFAGWLFALLLCAAAVHAEPRATPLYRGLADQLYCQLAGTCSIGTLTVTGSCTGCVGSSISGASYITQVAEAGLTGEQVLASLATGYLKVTTTTGVLSSQATPIPFTDIGGTLAQLSTAVSDADLARIDADSGFVANQTVTKNNNGDASVTVNNNSNGTSARSVVSLVTDAAAANFLCFGSGYTLATLAGAAAASRCGIFTPATGAYGVFVGSKGAGAAVFFTNDTPSITINGSTQEVTFSAKLTPSQTIGITGTTTNNNVNAGAVGEFIMARCPGPATTATITVTIASPGVVTWASHPFSGTAPRFDACPVVFTTSGALPTGITASTNYWVIPTTISGNNFSIATSVANAIAGTAINTSGTQSGTHTGTAGTVLSTTATKDVTGVALTAGDWDCSGTSLFQFGATTSFTNLIGSISTTSATVGAQDTLVDYETPAAVPTAGADDAWTLPMVRQLNSATTNTFLVAQGTFTVSTLKAYGTIRCRRMR